MNMRACVRVQSLWTKRYGEAEKNARVGDEVWVNQRQMYTFAHGLTIHFYPIKLLKFSIELYILGPRTYAALRSNAIAIYFEIIQI